MSFICRVLIAGKVEEHKAHRAVINNTVCCWQQKQAEVCIYSRHDHVLIMETGNLKEELNFSTISVQRSKSFAQIASPHFAMSFLSLMQLVCSSGIKCIHKSWVHLQLGSFRNKTNIKQKGGFKEWLLEQQGQITQWVFFCKRNFFYLKLSNKPYY